MRNYIIFIFVFIFSNCNNVKHENKLKPKIVELDTFIINKKFLTFPTKQLNDTFFTIKSLIFNNLDKEKNLCPIELSEQIASMLDMSNIDDIYYLGRINKNSLFFIQHEFGQIIIIVSKKFNEICAVAILAMELGEDNKKLVYSKIVDNNISQNTIELIDTYNNIVFIQSICNIKFKIDSCSFKKVSQLNKKINKYILFSNIEKYAK